MTGTKHLCGTECAAAWDSWNCSTFGRSPRPPLWNRMRRITGFMGLQHIQPAPRPSALWDRMRRSMGFMGLQQILDSPSPPPLWDRVCRSMGFMGLQQIRRFWIPPSTISVEQCAAAWNSWNCSTFGRSPRPPLWNTMRRSMVFMGLQHIQPAPRPPLSVRQHAPQHGIQVVTGNSGFPVSPTPVGQSVPQHGIHEIAGDSGFPPPPLWNSAPHHGIHGIARVRALPQPLSVEQNAQQHGIHGIAAHSVPPTPIL